MKKINKRYHSFVFSIFMSILMSGIMSLCVTVYQLGLTEQTWTRFLGAWQFAFPFAFVISQGITPLVRRITMKIVDI